jgi:hypothetical protein
MMTPRRLCQTLLATLVLCASAFAGGPLYVTNSPGTPLDGKPYTWDPAAMPIKYTVDPGPMSSSGATVVVNNAGGLQRVAQMFQSWQSVPTAALSYSYAGPILSVGGYVKGADVTTAVQFNAITGSCKAAQQNPIVFDANGSLMTALGVDSDVIGFTQICATNAATGHITAAMITLNGAWLNGTQTILSDSQFADAITHEMGHFAGLDHSQINVDVLQNFSCDLDTLAGLPLMFPEIICPGRAESGLPQIPTDDAAWISHFYPGPTYSTTYGLITGTIYFSDATSAAQGVNVVVRAVDDPNTPQDESRRVTFSAVSGLYFTSNIGQSISLGSNGQPDNASGSPYGSRQAALIGYYEIPVLPGTYTVQVESINSAFTDGSSVGPLDPPVRNPGTDEFWKQNESAYDIPLQSDPITVTPGQTVPNINIILNGTQPTLDNYEDTGALFDTPPVMTWEAEVHA